MNKVGILGAGQLGRMLALAGYPLERTFSLYEPSGQASAGIGSIFNDPASSPESPILHAFLTQADVVTYEFEHLPLDLVEHIETLKVVRPGSRSLRICQHRGREKQLFDQLGIPTPAYALVESLAQLTRAMGDLGYPAVAKTTTQGYDGKGQFVLRSENDLNICWQRLNGSPLIVEQFVKFRRELSIIAVRDARDDIRIYPMTENIHDEGILRYSIAPARNLDTETERLAQHYIRSLLRELDHIGVLTLELFETEHGLLANEMAPRVHNSGHWSIEGARCSQFENHIRAVCDLPLGDTDALMPTCMINIIGEKGDVAGILKRPFAHLHLYGKSERPGRKLGHVTVQADRYEELQWRVRALAELLPGCPEFPG
jgi:5-(carboxyamino)imidazole ribonucleotide synthase